MDALEFSVSGAELEKLRSWIDRYRCSFKKKKNEYAKNNGFSAPCGGWAQYKYIFLPTALGDLLTVKCECGKKIELECDNFG